MDPKYLCIVPIYTEFFFENLGVTIGFLVAHLKLVLNGFINFKAFERFLGHTKPSSTSAPSIGCLLLLTFGWNSTEFINIWFFHLGKQFCRK